MRYGPTPPKELPKQDVKTVMLAAERWQRASSAHAVWAEGAKKAVDFFEGRQWTAEALADMQKQKRPALTFNMIAPLVRLIMGYQRNNKTDLLFRPGHDGRSSETTGEALTQLAKSIAGHSKLQYTDAEVFMDGIVGGRGFYRSILDFENNDLGDILARAVDPFTVFIDPDADTYDLNESAAYVQVSKYLSLDMIEDCYGKATAELLRPFTMGQTPISSVTSAVVNDETTPVRYFGNREQGSVEWWDSFYATMGDFVDTGRKTLRVIEMEHQVREQRNVLIDLETGDKKVLPDDWGKDKIAKILWYGEQVGNPLQVQKRMVKRVQWTTICGDMILFDRPSPYDSYSLTPYFPYFRRGMTRGAVEDMIDPQMEKNKRRSIEIEMVTKTSNGGWSYHADSLSPRQKQNLKNFGASPGFMMEWQGQVEPKQLAPAAPSTSHERLEQKADADLMKISGINESALGQLDRVQSGRAIEARQRQAVIAIQMYMDNFTRTKQLIGEKWLELIQGHYTEERMFRILGEDGRIVKQMINELRKGQPQIDPMTGQPARDPTSGDPIVIDPVTGQRLPPGVTTTIVNDVTVGKYLVSVDETPLSATFASAQFEEMMTLMEKMGPSMAPFIPAFADLMMDVSSLPRKDEWIERFKTVAPQVLGFDPTTPPAPPPVPLTDPATGQPMIDQATGQPVMVDPQTGQPVQGGPQGQLPPPGGMPGGQPPQGPPGPAAGNAPSMDQGMTQGGVVQAA